MVDYLKIINNLKALELSDYPIVEIKKMLTSFGKSNVVVLTLHKGKKIIRARPNKTNETFKNVSEISFKPSICNKTYQRASTPATTMFYGCVVPENLKKEELNNARVTAILEASKLYRNGFENGEEKITFSQWRVIDDIQLIAIVYNQDFVESSSHTNELYLAYQRFLKYSKSSEITKNNVISDFLANQFSKTETNNDYDYLISALYSELVVQKSFGGIYYPSVRTKGVGFNVAIHPNIVSSCMVPSFAVECTLSKDGNNVVLNNDSLAKISIGQTDLNFKSIIK